LNGNVCLPVGSRLVQDEAGLFCGVKGELESQKELQASCQNHYECGTNFCTSGKCFDLEKEVGEAKGILQTLIDLLNSIFGGFLG